MAERASSSTEIRQDRGGTRSRVKLRLWYEKLPSETEKPISKSAEVHKREAAALLKSTKSTRPCTAPPLSRKRCTSHNFRPFRPSKTSAKPKPPPPHLSRSLCWRFSPSLATSQPIPIPLRTKPHAYTARKLSPALKQIEAKLEVPHDEGVRLGPEKDGNRLGSCKQKCQSQGDAIFSKQ
jgi:hypothetical protein